MTFIVVPHGKGGVNTRSFEISYRRLTVVALALLLLLVVWLGTTGTWLYLASRASRVPGLEQEIARLEAENEQVTELAQALRRLESQYMQVREMLGANRPANPGSIWLPAVIDLAITDFTQGDSLGAAVPRVWPLSQRGFITREHLGRVPGEHHGIDIAISEGSYVRASGGGVVTEAGQDSVYGNYIRIRHAEGFETVYGHASELFVTHDEEVEARQVIALSGNTGTSTAPHLHFEVWKDGVPIDPREFVDTP